MILMEEKTGIVVRDEDHGSWVRALWEFPNFLDTPYVVLHQDGSTGEWRGPEGPDGRRVKLWPDGYLVWYKEGEMHRDCFSGHGALPAIESSDGSADWFYEGVFVAGVRSGKPEVRRCRDYADCDSVTEEAFEDILTDLSSYAEQFK
jgi:hypothetical protein